ncbi:MAG: NUDIX hydrolase [Hyphomicrobiales bacterium]|nr:MAG: NUDIX hydrolase [Hyphomicrobiales bacterium]
MTDLLKRLTDAERRTDYANRRPVDAATLMILDRDSGKDVRVLMGRRHMRHKFMPGKFVFPGGRVDPVDSRVPFIGDYDPAVAGKLTNDMKGPKTLARARAFALAAIRETYEETGVFIGRKTDDPAPLKGSWEAFTERSLMPDLAPVRVIARAITPPRRPRRFDTRFLAVWADSIAETLPEGTGPSGELEEVDWLTLDEAKGLELPTITLTIIEELETRLKSDPDLAPETETPYYYWRGAGFIRQMV